MKPNAPIPHPVRSAAALLALVFAASLAAQQADEKPAPTPDPVKGMPDPTPLTAAELERLRRGEPAAGLPYRERTNAPASARAAQPPQDTVLFDEPGDGRIWAAGASYKASFGADGFVYVPFFGSEAPRNFPVQFVVRAVRVGGEPLALAAAEPQQAGTRVTFARGALREIYDLAPGQVEQTFVVETARPGDVEVELEVTSELVEDAAAAGIQFGNTLGQVHYGEAFLVDGAQKRAIATEYANGTIRLRVPAALRGEGPVVIDPILGTTAFSQTGTLDSAQPDIAYDAGTDTWLAVWERHYSAVDIDVYSQFWTGGGSVIASSLAVIDITTLSHAVPRVANLNAYDRFLVVMQRYENSRWQIWGRLRLANSLPHAIVFPISEPALSGHCINPDIGGDPGTGDQFLVVWQRELSATDFDIHARQVRADILVAPNTIFVENTAATIYSMPSISQSNGNGFVLSPRWVVAYQYRYSAIDEDIYGAVIAQNGVMTLGTTPIDTSVASDLVPSVSSPATDFSAGNPMFMVTYERQSPFEARARLLDATLLNQIPSVNLTQSFGLGPFWVRAESDGNRFAVVNGAATISVATLGMGVNTLVLNDPPHALPVVTPTYPRIASKRSGGGPRTDYGLAYADTDWFPDRIAVSAYGGYQPNAAITRRVMGCNGLSINAAGRAFLGENVTFTLSGFGADLPGMIFSSPVPASTTVCATCPIGVASAGAIVVFTPSLNVNLPPSTAFVGFTAAVQGFAFGSGPCIATLRFSDTFDFTIG